MKKDLTHIMAVIGLTSMLFTASCTKVDNPGAVGVESEVTFNVSTPDFMTRAYGDGETATELIVAVYDGNNDTYLPEVSKAADLEQKAATVTLSLVNGMAYKIVFWAQAEDAPYEFNPTEKTMTVDYFEAESNDENRDAFYFVKEYTANGAKTEPVTLTRPFAQLNVVAKDHLSAAASGVEVTKTEVTVKQVFSQMNILTGEVEVPVDVTFELADTPAAATTSQTLEGYEAYQWLSMNYLLVNEKELVDVTMTTNSDKVSTKTYSSIPVQRNYRTNIHGNILTSETDFDVNVDSGFGGENKAEDVAQGIYLDNEGNYVVTEAAGLEWLANMANTGQGTKAEAAFLDLFVDGQMTVVLSDNIDLAGENWTPINLVADDTYTLTIDGNGHEINNMKVQVQEGYYLGFIGQMKMNVVIKNLTFTNSVVEGTYEGIGTVIGYMTEGSTATLTNVNVENGEVTSSLTSTYGDGVGGLIGRAEGCLFSIDNCTVSGTTLKGKKNVSGLVSSSWNTSSTISNCTITGNTFYYESVDGGNLGYGYYDCNEYGDGSAVKTKCSQSNNSVNKLELADNQNLSNLVKVDNAVVNLPAGDYTFPTTWGQNVTLICDAGVRFTGQSSLNINGSTVQGARFSATGIPAVDHSTVNGTFKNCYFEGTDALHYCYAGETVVFENCTFDPLGQGYGVQFDGMANPVTFKNCHFMGMNAFTSSEKLLTIDGCTFSIKGKGHVLRNMLSVYGKTKISNTKFEFTAEPSSADQYIRIIGTPSDQVQVEFEYCTILNPSNEEVPVFEYLDAWTEGVKISIDGNEYTSIGNGLYTNAAGEVIVSKSVDMLKALATNATKIVLMPGEYVGCFDIENKSDLSIRAESAGVAKIKGLVYVTDSKVKLLDIHFSNPDAVLTIPDKPGDLVDDKVNGMKPVVGVYTNTTIEFENCDFDISGDAVYGFSSYASTNATFTNCRFECYNKRPIANNGASTVVSNCTFNNQYHYSVRLFENNGEKQTVIYTNNTIIGTNDKDEFEGINISKKGSTATILGDFTIKGNTNTLKYRHHKNVTMSANCTYDTDITNFAFEKEN